MSIKPVFYTLKKGFFMYEKNCDSIIFKSIEKNEIENKFPYV